MAAQYTVRPMPPLEPCIGHLVRITLVNGVPIHGTLTAMSSLTGCCTVTSLSPNEQFEDTYYFNAYDVVSFSLTEWVGDRTNG